MKFSTLFSGCGGADAGLRAAGFQELWGIELNDAYANIARANDFNVLTQDVQLTDWESLERPDWLHASPPCVNASVANSKAGETQLDRDLAESVAKAIAHFSPSVFTLENVRGYRDFAACRRYIVEALYDGGYCFVEKVLNAAAYGVPQVRDRYWIIATKKPAYPELPISEYAPYSQNLSWLHRSYRSWDDAICPFKNEASMLSDRMRSKLPTRPFNWHLCSGWEKTRDITMLPMGQPAPTITTSMNRPSLMPWVVARDVDGVLLEHCLDVPQLAALQSFPSGYRWGDNPTAARQAIGNAVPPLMMTAIARSNLSEQAIAC